MLIIKTEQNTLLKEFTLDNNEKLKIKETVSSGSITNNTINKNIKKDISNEFTNLRDNIINMKYSDNLSNKDNINLFEDKNVDINKKIKNRAIIPNKKDKGNKSFYKRAINKDLQNIKNQKSVDL